MTLNIGGTLLDAALPQVMGIVNITPDSFYGGSRAATAAAIHDRVAQLLDEGAWMIDVGACSTRPGASAVAEAEELQRLTAALEVIRRDFPTALVSVDTFRAAVAERCVLDYGVAMVNDVSGGSADARMFDTVAALGVPYVLTHGGGLASVEMAQGLSGDELLQSVARFFEERLQQLHGLGVSDVVLDPGFGFGKSMEQNYTLLHGLRRLTALFPNNVFLAGLSRKSMVYQLLNTTPERALNGTTVVNTIALTAGATLLRVHDVQEAVEAVKIIRQCR